VIINLEPPGGAAGTPEEASGDTADAVDRTAFAAGGFDATPGDWRLAGVPAEDFGKLERASAFDSLTGVMTVPSMMTTSPVDLFSRTVRP